MAVSSGHGEGPVSVQRKHRAGRAEKNETL